ncbi:DUF3443 family protein [Amantichitinum ursilacus]|uniref:DUF3443 domain-containing protein n=1 Tax=Amantichitinum ursilacus TaxID=857265 RepID=A0A0N0GQQ7_9NEIS|nr:DUF3443 family protein [Amantichitinum ursilacus]KPC54671.1 hypothetical protein WG78_03830 [Amantichitinum ursilacus]
MRQLMIALIVGLFGLGALLSGCNGVVDGTSGDTTPTPTPVNTGRALPAAANNVATVVVDAGPSAVQAVTRTINVPYVTVTVCLPSSTTCATIDHVLVDTASTGLRLVASALGTLNGNLPVQRVTTSQGSGVLAACLNFADGDIWGPVKRVDLTISGETASNLPIQVIGDASYPDSTVPSTCSGVGVNENTVAELGANGVLGIAPQVQDCGSSCANTASGSLYYVCPSASSCTATTLATGSQIANPVSYFTTDNNGTALAFPTIADSGASSVTGALIFGIGTQTNNTIGTEKALDATGSYTPIAYNGTTYPNSFVDSGSNLYFLPSAISINQCSSSSLSGYYCPSAQTTLGLTIYSATQATSTTASINIGNTQTLTSDSSLHAFNNLGVVNSAIPNSIDLGMPFFYGRWVFNALEGASTSAGTGPYVAF